MKTSLLFVAFLAVFATANGQSLCEKYADLVTGGDQEALMGAVITEVFGNLLLNPITLPFFDGSAKAGLTNFTDPAQSDALDNLVVGLVTYFGSPALLDCNDATFPEYTGGPMQAVHSNLPISYVVWFNFNAEVVQSALNLGVSADDALLIGKVLATGDTLEDDGTFFSEICNVAADCGSFCNFYSNALVLSNNDLLEAVVVNTFTNITVDGSPILKYFDGTTVNSKDGNGDFEATDFTIANSDQAGLVEGLKSFFGDALGCSDETLAKYSGEKDMAKVHEPMNSKDDETLIEQNEFDFFNDELIAVLISFGVADADAKAVRVVLDSFEGDICGGCAGGDGSSASLLIPALFAVIPMLAFFF